MANARQFAWSISILLAISFAFLSFGCSSGPVEVAECKVLQNSETLEFCLLRIAIEQKNTTICGLIGNVYPNKNQCYQSVAVVKNDTLVCELIGESDPKKYCEGVVTLNAQACGEIVEKKSKSECVRYVASHKKDPSICGLLGDFGEKDSCYYNVAEAMHDRVLCGNIVSQFQRDSCYKSVKRA
ncbi:MAG: hypothetical protein V1909_03660 [Candidatus Micrarchaeota archaeon]